MHDFQSDIDAISRIEAVPTILDVLCRTTGLGFAAIARVTGDRWITCHVLDSLDFELGIGDELEVDTTICHEIRQSREPVIINNVGESEQYRTHHTPRQYGFESYISMPIVRKDGRFFGTLCALDPRLAMLDTPETIGMFKLFAELIAAHLDADEKLTPAERKLDDEQKLAELREQFIAVLGHDLRNPIAAIEAGTNVLARASLDQKSASVVELMRGSLQRMTRLIDNLLDFARGRLGGGLTLERGTGEPLRPALEQVVRELCLSHSGSPIEARFDFADPVDCDPSRIGQMLSNLLGNALTHGASGEPVRVTARDAGRRFEIAVHNTGRAIDPGDMVSLFEPFFRARGRSSGQGLGLGLYIASQIAEARDGALQAVCANGETVFRFSMELADASRPLETAE